MVQRRANVLIGQRGDLLLWLLIVGEGFIVLLPVLTRGAGHLVGCGGDETDGRVGG